MFVKYILLISALQQNYYVKHEGFLGKMTFSLQNGLLVNVVWVEYACVHLHMRACVCVCACMRGCIPCMCIGLTCPVLCVDLVKPLVPLLVGPLTRVHSTGAMRRPGKKAWCPSHRQPRDTPALSGMKEHNKLQYVCKTSSACTNCIHTYVCMPHISAFCCS